MPGFDSHLSTKDSQLLRMPGARIFVRSTSFVLWERLYQPPGARRGERRYKSHARKNFFAKRRMRAGRCNAVDGGLTSPTLRVGGNLLCKIVQFGWFREARPSRMLVSASRRNNLFLTRESRGVVSRKKSPRSRDAFAST